MKNSKIKIIQDGEQVLAKLIPESAWEEGLSFFSNDNDFIQVGTWNYSQGKKLLGHIHNKVERKIDRTQEVIFVKQGRIEARIYNLEEKLIDTFEVEAGQVLILLSCGHGYTILEDNTQVLEVKNGPYLGADIDRYRIETNE